MGALHSPDVRALGVRAQLLSGEFVPTPVKASIAERLESIEVTHSDEGRSGFQLVVRLERRPGRLALDYPQLHNTFEPYHRVAIVISFGLKAVVLMEGVVTRRDIDPVDKRLTITGQDVGFWMDQEERSVPYHNMTVEHIVRAILARHLSRGIRPEVAKPRFNGVPLRGFQQHGTDLRCLELLAERHGMVFYIEPGAVVGVPTAYWGPRKRAALPQPALAVDMAGTSNLLSISFATEPTRAATVAGSFKDPTTGLTAHVRTLRSMRSPALSQGELLDRPRSSRLHLFRGDSWQEEQARAQGETDRSADEVVVGEGELDARQYGSVLRARGVVGVQGAGLSHDGYYYVKRVTHKLTHGSYTQGFTIVRGGSGALETVVRA